MTDRTASPPNEPAASRVPLSGGAVTALVLSIVIAVVGIVGPWWSEVVPLLIVLACWRGVFGGRRRGKVVAILALVISLCGAAAHYFIQQAAAAQLSESFAPVVRALANDDRAKLEAWVGTGADRDARLDRWLARAKAAREAVGTFRGDLDVSFRRWGFVLGLLGTPSFRQEFEPRGAEPPTPGATFWFRAPCANGDVFVAFDYGPPERFNAAMEKARSERPVTESSAEPRALLDTPFAGNADEIRLFH